MQFAFKSLVLASSLVAAGLSSAGAVTIGASGSVVSGDWTLSGTSGAHTLVFSRSLIGALNAGGIQLSDVKPTTVTAIKGSTGKYTSVSALAPLGAVSGDVSGATFTPTSSQSTGGPFLTAVEDDFTTTGGTLSLTNFRVDYSAKKVFVTAIGGNGVGTVNDLYLWDIANVAGVTSASLVEGENTFSNKVSGLTINANAFSLFSKSLGLTDAGDAAFSRVTDFGEISTVSTFTAVKSAPAIPEPSTYALMGLGLAGMALAARRRRAK